MEPATYLLSSATMEQRGSKARRPGSPRPAQQENTAPGGKTPTAAWSGWISPQRKPLGKHTEASLTAAAIARPTDEISAASRACKGSAAAAILRVTTLATPPQLLPNEKPGWKASQAALTRGVGARHAAFADSPMPAASKTAASNRADAAEAAASASGISLGGEAARSEGPAPASSSAKRERRSRWDQPAPAATASKTGPLRQPEAAAVLTGGRGLSAGTAARKELAGSTSKSRGSLASKSYRTGTALRGLAVRGVAARWADAEGSPAKRRGVSSSPDKARRAALKGGAASARSPGRVVCKAPAVAARKLAVAGLHDAGQLAQVGHVPYPDTALTEKLHASDEHRERLNGVLADQLQFRWCS